MHNFILHDTCESLGCRYGGPALHTFLDPVILFFILGVFAGTIRSNLEIPPAISRFLSLYLLMALGLKGGFALAKSGLTHEVGTSLACALVLAVIIPLIGYQVLRRILSPFDAAAMAATYGSVSAVTFITAVQYLDRHELAYGGHMAAALAMMESPAIIIAVTLACALRQKALGAGAVMMGDGGAALLGGQELPRNLPLGKILHESLTDGAQLLLLGAMLIGLVTGEAGKIVMQPFTGDLFKGMLAFFLLDMGVIASRNLPKLDNVSPWLILYAVLGPIFHAGLALLMAMALGFTAGNGALLMVLAASASYIAVPAVVRFAIPEAQPTLYLGMSLGVTFPLNILFGIPVYVAVAERFL